MAQRSFGFKVFIEIIYAINPPELWFLYYWSISSQLDLNDTQEI